MTNSDKGIKVSFSYICLKCYYNNINDRLRILMLLKQLYRVQSANRNDINFDIFQMEQMAVAATCPVLVSIVRSLEVVMALIIDIITRDNFVHVDDMRFWYKVIGACTVTLCVTSMSVADKIHQGLTACTRYNYFIEFLF